MFGLLLKFVEVESFHLRLFLLSVSLNIICLPFDSLFLLRKRKAGGERFESLEAKLKDRAETLSLSLEQKTKDMKQRDKKVYFISDLNLLILISF